jgi:hypothetical protein
MGAIPGLRAFDSVAGALLGAAAGIVLSWAIGAALLYLPGQSQLRRSVQDSAILSRINEEFPPERLLETLERVDPLGVLVGPPAIVAPPNSKLARDPDVVIASRSVVRITGLACGLGIEGSGWIAARELVVTNAHVVAGIERPQVDRGGGAQLTSAVIAFDAKNDLAVLRVPGLQGRPLTLAEPERAVPVVLIGYPGNGPLTRIPGRLGWVARDREHVSDSLCMGAEERRLESRDREIARCQMRDRLDARDPLDRRGGHQPAHARAGSRGVVDGEDVAVPGVPEGSRELEHSVGVAAAGRVDLYRDRELTGAELLL